MKLRKWLALILSLMLVTALASAQATSADGTGKVCRNHHFEVMAERPASCTGQGMVVYYCPNCGEGYEEMTGPLGHDWQLYSSTATCMDGGQNHYRCSRCGEEKTETGSPLGHDYGPPQVDIPATCTETGRDVRICSRDRTHVWYLETEALGHDWGDWETVTAASASAPGLEQRVCKRDSSHVEQREIPPLETTAADSGQLEEVVPEEEKPEEPEPVVPGRRVPGPSLVLMVTCGDPEPFWFNFDSYTNDIQYFMTVINDGSVSVLLTELWVGSEGLDVSGSGIILMPSESITIPVTHRFNESEVSCNQLAISFLAGGMWEGDSVISNECELVHATEDVQPPWLPDSTSVFVIKMETSTSKELGGYQVDEIVTYEVGVTNTCDVAIPSITISDDHSPGGDVTLYDLQPYETRFVGFQYTVTQPDVDAGYILNTATATWTCPVTQQGMSEWSTCCVGTTEIPDKVQYGIDVMKSCLTAPLEGSFYQENETVTFYVYVENTSGVELFDVDVTDPLTGDVVHYDSMTPGQIDDLYFTYTITGSDAAMGSVTNTVTAAGRDANYNTYAMTDSVTIDTGVKPDTKPSSLYVYKEETSVPADPKGYQEKEWIQYQITVTNDGETDLTAVDVYDITPAGYHVMLGSVPLMHPNDSQTFTYAWQVEGWNVDDQWVWNSAIAYYTSDTDFYVPVVSNMVQSPTWGPEPVPPVTIAPPVTPGPGDPETGNPGPPETGTGEGGSCMATLVSSGSTEILYEQELCGEHGKTAQKAEELAAAGAWNEVCALWLEDIREMYDRISQTVPSEERAKVAADRAELEHLAANTPDSQAKAEWLMLQCAELCYLNANAPADRPDSRIFGRLVLLKETVPAGESTDCGLTLTPESSRKALVTETLCKDHAAGEETVTGMLENSLTPAQYENVFIRSSRLWRSALDAITTIQWRAAAPEEQAVITARRQTFDRWVAARTELLKMLYADNPEVTAEVINDILRRQVLSSCEPTP